jgi:hypothetical protein
MEELKTYIQSEIQKGIEKVLSSKNYISIEDYNSLKTSYVDTVELLANAMRRITQLESGLFLKDSEGEIIRDDNDKPIISPKIESEVIADAEKELFIPSGKYEKGAVELAKFAATMKPLMVNLYLIEVIYSNLYNIMLWGKEVQSHNLLTFPVRTKTVSSMVLVIKTMLLEMELT